MTIVSVAALRILNDRFWPDRGKPGTSYEALRSRLDTSERIVESRQIDTAMCKYFALRRGGEALRGSSLPAPRRVRPMVSC